MNRSWTHVTVLSLETWDDVWRRNQHLASRLVTLGYADRINFVTPPAGGLAARARSFSPLPKITVTTPPLVVPRRWGGHRVIGAWQRHHLGDTDLIWINDPVAGAAVVHTGLPMVYDVTDDWRSMPQSEADRRRIIDAEDLLAEHATTVACSPMLVERWRDRYGVTAALIPNGVDTDAIRTADPMPVPGRGPHAVYVGTLHPSRLDESLVIELAERWPGTLHLVGPIGLADALTEHLLLLGAHLPGPVPSSEVPRWLASADVLVCPHLVDDFTLSLDAIKSHEYLATNKPVVATPSSGFQSLQAPGLAVIDAALFVDAALAAAELGPYDRDTAVDWDERTHAFAQTCPDT